MQVCNCSMAGLKITQSSICRPEAYMSRPSGPETNFGVRLSFLSQLLPRSEHLKSESEPADTASAQNIAALALVYEHEGQRDQAACAHAMLDRMVGKEAAI